MNVRVIVKLIVLIISYITLLQAGTGETVPDNGTGFHKGGDSTAVLKGMAEIDDAHLDSTRLTHGPVVYGATDTSALIFCRTNQSSEVAIEYSTERDLIGSFVTDGYLTIADYDFVAHIPLTDLTPLTRYYYTFIVDGNRIEQGNDFSFMTFPQETDIVDHSFAVVADASSNRFEPAVAYDDINMVDPNFMVKLGDFDHRDPAGQSNPADIEDWRRMHREMIRNSVAGAAFAEYIGGFIPVCYMWDDHDYGGNNADMYAAWKPVATQAFREYHPNYPLANPDGGNWYKFRCAQSEIFVLDLRSQRDNNWDADNEEKSMLDGNNITDGQNKWLLEGLQQSTATWKFIMSTVPFNPTVYKFDSWVMFQIERTEIVDFINTNEIKNVIFISADIHTGGAIDDGTNSDFPEISVPHSNYQFAFPFDCAALDCGTWSEGFFSGYEANGFALINVSSDSVELMTWSASGENQISLTVLKE